MTWHQLTDIGQGIVDLLAKGWPLAAVLVALVLRPLLQQIIDKLYELKFKIAGVDVVAAMQSGSEPRPSPRTGTPSSAESGGLATGGTTRGPAERGDPWRRCGNIYWNANNIGFSAIALLQGRIDVARAELEHAIHHASKMDIGELADELRTLRNFNLADANGRAQYLDTLIRTAVRIAHCAEKNQPDFPELDVRH
jgi:hypothetical protein